MTNKAVNGSLQGQRNVHDGGLSVVQIVGIARPEPVAIRVGIHVVAAMHSTLTNTHNRFVRAGSPLPHVASAHPDTKVQNCTHPVPPTIQHRNWQTKNTHPRPLARGRNAPPLSSQLRYRRALLQNRRPVPQSQATPSGHTLRPPKLGRSR